MDEVQNMMVRDRVWRCLPPWKTPSRRTNKVCSFFKRKKKKKKSELDWFHFDWFPLIKCSRQPLRCTGPAPAHLNETQPWVLTGFAWNSAVRKTYWPSGLRSRSTTSALPELCPARRFVFHTAVWNTPLCWGCFRTHPAVGPALC